MRITHVLSSLAVAGLVATSCGSAADDGYATADRILVAVGADGAQTDAERAAGDGAACETEWREDEYGFLFEVCVASESSDSDQETRAGQLDEPPVSGEPGGARSAATDVLPLDRFDELVAGVPQGDASRQLVTLGDTLDSMDAACATSPGAWIASLGTVAQQARNAGASVLGDTGLEGYRRQTEAVELSRVIVERAVLQSGCIDPASAAADVDSSDLLPATAQLSAAVESLFQALWNGQQVSPYFSHVDELAHWRWMREEGSIDVVIAGTSQALLGVEPDLLEEWIGQSVGNVSIPGALAETQQHWLPQVVQVVHPKTVVWGIGPLDLVGVCPPDGRGGGFRQLLDLKAAAFASVPVARGTPGIDLILGSVGSTDFSDTLMVDDIEERFVGPRGDVFEFSGRDPAQLATTLEQSSPPFENGTLCENRLRVIERVIDDLERSGVEVIVFGMPVAASLAARFPGGDAALDILLDTAAVEVFEPAGATYAGTMNSLDHDGWWYDVVHPTRGGGVALTRELAAALIEVGT